MALGFVFHFLIALGFAAVYNLASRPFPVLIRQPVICGLLYGAAAFGFMRLVVLPLSRAPKFKSGPVALWSDFASHLFFVGLTIAFFAWREGRSRIR